MNIPFAATHPGVRLGAVIAGTLLVLVTIITIVRPDMMSMRMIQDQIVGFGL